MERTFIGGSASPSRRTGEHPGLAADPARPEEDAVPHPARPHRAGAGGAINARTTPSWPSRSPRWRSESALTITGTVVDNPIVKLGGLEMQLEIAAGREQRRSHRCRSIPLPRPCPMIDFRMDWRYLDLRRPENLLIFKVQTTAEACHARILAASTTLSKSTPPRSWARPARAAPSCSRWIISNARPTWRSRRSSTSRWPWRPGSSASSRSVRSSAPTLPSPPAT